MPRVNHDPFARGSYDRKSQGPGECQNCGQRYPVLYSYVWVGDDNNRPLDALHRRAKLFCGLDCFKSYYS